MSNSKKEREYQTKLGEMLLKEIGIWSYIIPDTPTLTSAGFTRTTNEFDTIVACRGIAIEFKFCTGLSMNIKKWKEDRETRHQYKDLKAFAATKSGEAVLFVFWKETGKRDIRRRWCYVHELDDVDCIYFRDMRKLDEFMELVCDLNNG